MVIDGGDDRIGAGHPVGVGAGNVPAAPALRNRARGHECVAPPDRCREVVGGGRAVRICEATDDAVENNALGQAEGLIRRRGQWGVGDGLNSRAGRRPGGDAEDEAAPGRGIDPDRVISLLDPNMRSRDIHSRRVDYRRRAVTPVNGGAAVVVTAVHVRNHTAETLILLD